MYSKVEYFLKDIIQEFFDAYVYLRDTPRPEVGSTARIYSANNTLQQCKKLIPIFFDAYYEVSNISEDLSTSVREICFSIKAIKSGKSKKQIELNAKELERLFALWEKYNGEV